MQYTTLDVVRSSYTEIVTYPYQEQNIQQGYILTRDPDESESK